MAAHRRQALGPEAWAPSEAGGLLSSPAVQDVIRSRRRGRHLVGLLLLNAGRMVREHEYPQAHES